MSLICIPYTWIFDHLVDSLIGLTLQESYIGLALCVDLSFNLSFDRAILKNLGHCLGLQILARSIPVFVNALPLWNIVLTAFHSGSQDLLFAIPFVAQIFVAGSCGMAFQPSCTYVRGILSLLARLRTYRHVGFQSILEIEILFKHFSL